MLLLFLALLFAAPAFACSCAPAPLFCASPPSSAQSDESAIFVGTLESTTPIVPQGEDPEWKPWRDRQVRFRVDETFVGNPGPTFELNGGSGQCCDCSMHFASGEQYLIIANRWQGSWRTSTCSGSGLVKHTRHNIESLRAWKNGLKQPPAIYGMVSRMPKDTPFRIEIKGPSVARQATADTDGHFSFPNLIPAKYIVKAVTPGWLLFPGHGETVDLTERPCELRYLHRK